jgi:hypothetical protein
MSSFPTTIEGLKKKSPKLYEDFLREKLRYGLTFKQYRSKFTNKAFANKKTKK